MRFHLQKFLETGKTPYTATFSFDFSQADFPGVLTLLGRLTAGENLEKAAEK